MLSVRGVSRSYGDHRVLHDVSFTADRGRLTGFVGGNGAGKTTTMRIILGVLSPDEGTVELDGAPLDGPARARIGYMPEERGLYPKMPVVSQVAYLARLHGMDRDASARRARELVEHLGLSERASSPLESLSLGNQQRVQIAAALVAHPDVLVLDEPFSGLDPHAVDVVLEVLTEHARNGAVVLFSSHQLDVVERLCEDIVIINSGRIVAAGDTSELREREAGSVHEILSPADLSWVAQVPGVRVLQAREGAVVFDASDGDPQMVLAQAVARGPVTSFRRVIPSLAQTYKHLTASTKEDA